MAHPSPASPQVAEELAAEIANPNPNPSPASHQVAEELAAEMALREAALLELEAEVRRQIEGRRAVRGDIGEI